MRLKTFLKEQDVQFGGDGEMSAVEANPDAAAAGAQMQSIRTIIEQGLDEIGEAMADGHQDYDDDLQDAIIDQMVAEIVDLFVDAPADEAPPAEDEAPPAEDPQF